MLGEWVADRGNGVQERRVGQGGGRSGVGEVGWGKRGGGKGGIYETGIVTSD